VIASAFAILWTVDQPFRESALGNALAALFIVAAPAYAGGNLLALLGDGRAGRAPLALAGVALGILLSAAWVIPRTQAAAIFAGAATLVFAASVASRDPDEAEEGRIDMKGRVVIVTGAGARGQVGYSVADRFVRAEARVIVSGRDAGIESLAAALSAGGEAIGVKADLLVDADVARLVSTARERYGRLDALINVAGGLSVIKPIADTSPAEWRSEIERNADTTLRVSRAALPLLRENGGAIVNFAAPAGIRAVKGMGAYSAAKAAIVALTRALALEERQYSVRVNAIAPGLVDTEQNRSGLDHPDEAKFVTRDEIAEVALFLASDASSGISGETIHVLGEGLR
jgi:NAD(P)-dependent dehydrogenase (short-subunit alcohol dehydrogenase family)